MLEEWCERISLTLGSGFDIIGKREQVIEDAILYVIFSIKTSRTPSEVVSAVVETGQKYKRGRRRFFIFDQHRQFLFLLSYPYYLLQK